MKTPISNLPDVFSSVDEAVKMLKLENKVELNVKKQQQIESLLEGTIKPIKGHFVWEINEETGDIKKAEYRKDTVVAFSTQSHKEKLVTKPDCVYIPALNAENAKKKYLKNKEQHHYYIKPSVLNLNDLKFS